MKKRRNKKFTAFKGFVKKNKYTIGLVLLCLWFVAAPIIRKPETKVEVVQKIEASKKTLKAIPTAKTEIKVNIPKAVIGKEPEVKIVETKAGEVLQLTSYKSKFGYFKGPTLFVGGYGEGLSAGFGFQTVFYDRFSLDALFGNRNLGLGISGNVLKNTCLGLAYQTTYTGLSGPMVYLSIGL